MKKSIKRKSPRIKRKSPRIKRHKTRIKRKSPTKLILNNNVKENIVKKHYDEKFMKNKEGDYFDEHHYDKIVKYECDGCNYD